MFDISESQANAWFNIANVILTLGAVLALIGTAGTIWLSGVREKYSERRNSENERKISDNVADTAKANEEAARANKEAAKLNERAESLAKEAADAKLETQKLAEKLQAAKDKADAAHKIASTTEEKQRPRSIPSDKRAELLAFLKNAPHGNVTLGATESDLEAMAFMKSLSSLLREAGNNVTESPWIMASGPNGAPVGLILIVKNKDKAPLFATAILNALHGVGLSLVGVDKPSLEDENILIIEVGAKPP